MQSHADPTSVTEPSSRIDRFIDAVLRTLARDEDEVHKLRHVHREELAEFRQNLEAFT